MATKPRADLLYRDLVHTGIEDNQSYLDDSRFDEITEKVIAYMSRTEPENWSKDQWRLFQALWADRKKKQRTSLNEATALTVEELKAIL